MKKRLFYSLAIGITIILGLSTRKFSHALPPFVVSHFGDALWAAMVYFGFRLLLPARPAGLAVLLSLLFSFGIEFGQLYQAEWINSIRNTTFGALVLGKGFLWIDLMRYTCGILLSFAADRLLFQKERAFRVGLRR